MKLEKNYNTELEKSESCDLVLNKFHNVKEETNFIKLGDGSYLYKDQLIFTNNMITKRYNYIKSIDLSEKVSFFNDKSNFDFKFINNGIIVAVNKYFIEWYENNILDYMKLDNLFHKKIELNGHTILWTNPEDLYISIINKEVDKNDIILLGYNPLCESFFYTNGDWLTHYIKFNLMSSMVTSLDYNINDLYLYLLSRDDVKIYESKLNNQVTNSLYPISFSQNFDYINFYVKVNTDQYNKYLKPINLEGIVFELPKDIIDIRSFKKISQINI